MQKAFAKETFNKIRPWAVFPAASFIAGMGMESLDAVLKCGD